MVCTSITPEVYLGLRHDSRTSSQQPVTKQTISEPKQNGARVAGPEAEPTIASAEMPPRLPNGRRSPIPRGDPNEKRARTPPTARQKTPIGEDLGAGLRTPASASYEEHNFGDRGMFDRKHVRDNYNNVSKMGPEGRKERGRLEDTRAELLREHRRSPSGEPQPDARRHSPHHGQSSRGEEPSQTPSQMAGQTREDADASPAIGTKNKRPKPKILKTKLPKTIHQ